MPPIPRTLLVLLAGALPAGVAIGADQVASAASESPFFEELPTVLSASRLPQVLHEAPGAVTILDRDFIRAIEDVIELLMAKNLILFTDLPAKVQEKLLRRREVRQQTNYPGFLSGDDDIIPL